MTARNLLTNEVAQGALWDSGLFITDDGREWPENAIEILET